MNYSIIFFIIGWVLKIEAVLMLLPALVSFIYRDGNIGVFLGCFIVFFVIGQALTFKKPKSNKLFTRDGFIAVALCWVIMSVAGAVPFVISGEIPDPVDALFEIVSGFTTTGASILTNVEAMSHSMIFWRSFSHWIGGMGVLVFLLAILPMTGGQNINLIKAESTGPEIGKMVPRLQKSSGYLYAIYLVMSIIQLVLLLLGKMPLFDALCTMFGSAGTGGFGIKADSMASYSTYIQMVTAVSMLLFGVNFNFYFYLITKKVRAALGMEEVKWYFIIFAVATAAITINLCAVGGSPLISLRDSIFSVSSVMTSTGYATANFDKWPQLCRLILVLIMFSGACAGSTGGGMKVSRMIIYVKQFHKYMGTLVHPRSIQTLRMNGKKLEQSTITAANAYLVIYIAIYVISMIILSLDGFDFTSTFTAIAATFNNIGPGLGMVGPAGNFAAFSHVSKLVLTFDMLAGRLELFPMLVLLSPSAWRKNG